MSRALVKTLFYRTLMIVITVVAFAFTEDAGAALGLGFVSNAVKTCTYYGYERLWDRIAWGV